MELFIKIKDGKAVDHPIFGDNFRQAFPGVDTNNLPPEFAKFERTPPPPWGPYDKNQRVTYERGSDGVFRDVWACDKMTAEEIKAKQDRVKADWANSPIAFQSWTFNEEACAFQPPVPYPTDGKSYRWDEPSLSWVEDTNDGMNVSGTAPNVVG